MKTVGSRDCFVMPLDIQGWGALLGGKAGAYPGKTLSAVGLCPDTDFFCLRSGKLKACHTHTLTYTLPRNSTYPVSPSLRHTFGRGRDTEGLLEFDVSPPQ